MDKECKVSLSTYQIKNATPDSKKRKEYWNTGIGLNKVDNLEPSDYLISLAKENIEGNIDTEEVEALLNTHYEGQAENEHYECDMVSTRIVELLDQGSFTFSPQMLKSIHKYLFHGIYPDEIVGEFRNYNITKRESVLKGDTVIYGNWNMIKDLYEYDFGQERLYRYTYPMTESQIEHLSDFVSRIWQVHPFGEGNTRTTAVFTELYLRSMGFDVNNDMFKHHANFFRAALVRSNYRNVKTGIDVTYKYLNRFFSNLLAGTSYELKESELYCNQDGEQEEQKSPSQTKSKRIQDRTGIEREH